MKCYNDFSTNRSPTTTGHHSSRETHVTQSAHRGLTCQRLQPPRITGTPIISLRTTHTIFESPMSQSSAEAINMNEIPDVETGTGANPTPCYLGGPLASLTQESGSVDVSGPIVSMYLQIAVDEDRKMTENWKGHADSILIFVSLHSTSCTSIHIDPETEDWSILCRRRSLCCGVCPGPQAKFPGHLRI